MARSVIVMNAVGFQLCWFASVLGGNGPALIAVAAFALLHALPRRDPPLTAAQWRASAVFAITGMTADSLLLSAGFIAFGTNTGPLIPIWLMALWLAFSLTLPLSLRVFNGRPLLAALAGAIFAPLSYLAGEKAGALSLSLPGLAFIALFWALALMIWFLRMKKI